MKLDITLYATKIKTMTFKFTFIQQKLNRSIRVMKIVFGTLVDSVETITINDACYNSTNEYFTNQIGLKIIV